MAEKKLTLSAKLQFSLVAATSGIHPSPEAVRRTPSALAEVQIIKEQQAKAAEKKRALVG